MRRTIGILLISLLCSGTAWGNSIDSSTMVFEGTLTDAGGGVLTGTIAMTEGPHYCYTCPGTGDYVGGGSYPPGVDQGGFDVYALEGGTAYYDDAAQGTIGADHDAYSSGGGWGSYYQPDCADYEHYELTLDAGHWYLRYNGGTLGEGNATPMSGVMNWDSMYAAETDTGAYVTPPADPDANDGDALAYITGSTGATTGAGHWDMDWTWGSEAIPLQLPGFGVDIEDLGGGTYRVTLTPACPSEVWVDDDFDDGTPGWGITHFDSIQDGINAVSGSTVYVAPGTYTGNLTVPSGVVLTSTDGAPTTTIQGVGGVAINILGDDVTIDGFTITNHGGSNAIHAADHSGIAIVNNIITDIGSDTIQANVHAIAIVCTATDISGITIENNTISGIVARGIDGSGRGFSASGIAIGWSTGDYDVTDLLIRYNTIFAVDSRTDDWPAGHGAYGIILNHARASHAGKTIAPMICSNVIHDLEGLWSHGIGLEGDTPNAWVHGNTIYNLVDHKDPSDAVAVFVEDNGFADTVQILFNSFANVDVGVASTMSAAIVDAEYNWWDATSGPSTVGSGSGVMVGPYVDYEPWLTMGDIHLAAGGARLVELQQADGGWDWPLDDGDPNDPSPLNTVGPIAMGLAKAYRATGDVDMLDTLADAGALLLTKTNNFSLSDGYLAAELDTIFGGSTYVDHVFTNFYTPLATGTYDRNGAGTLYDTPAFLTVVSDGRHNGGIGNLTAWDFGMGLIAAASSGVTGTELQYWIDAVEAEVDMLDAAGPYDVIGLAGAVYGLAFVGADFDPTAGEHAAADSLGDLADILASYQIVETGGFTWDASWVIPYDYNETVQNTAYALLALDELGGYDAEVASAAAYLRSVQLCTGGWENYIDSTSGENNEVTGEALWALWGSDPATITLVADRDCYLAGDTVTIGIWMNDVAMDIAGGQFFLEFDTAALSFTAPSGAAAEAPFSGMYLAVPAAGQIDYSVQLDPMGTPQTVTGTQHMATLTFTATAQICHASDLITWRTHTPPSRLTTRVGAQGVYPELIALDVHDDEAPTIACPSDFAVQCEGDVPAAYADLAAFVVAGGTASDNCGTDLVLSLTNDTGLVGGICGGTVTRVYRVTDDCGNYTECTQIITVDDTEAPVIACPADVIVECDASTDPADTGMATATDNCDADITIAYNDSIAAGSCPQESVITRTWTATDDCDNVDTCEQTITVVDTTPPDITCPEDATIECDASTDPADTGSATATDNCDPAPTITYSDIVTAGVCPQESVITRTWTATDDCDNVSTCFQIITVVDTTPPEITCPADIIISAADAGACSAVLDPGTATATDNCDTSPTITGVRDDSLPLMDPYPSGTTTITWTAEDACGNYAECTQTVTVADESELIVDIALSPTMVTGDLTRCITFELWECPGAAPAATVHEEITFTDGWATGVTVMVPCGNYTCITARDKLHTLRSTDSDDFEISGTQYVADFTGDDQLIGGNLNDDPWVDILDFGVYSWQYPINYGTGDTTCATAYPHADINGSGIVETADFTFIQANFLIGHQDNCCGAAGLRLGGMDEFSGPITEISLAELRERGLGHLSVADLNADDRLDEADVAAFLMGARPEPKPNKPTPNPAAERKADLVGSRSR